MTLTLELSPEQETTLKAAAREEGVSLTDYALLRLFNASLSQKEPPPQPRVSPEKSPQFSEEHRALLEADAARAVAASGLTEEEAEEIAVQVVRQTRAEMRAREPAL